MQIDRILYPVESLGPGQRLIIWTVGCSKHCQGCSNKELWERNESKDISVDAMCNLIYRYLEGKRVDGITVTGGDPFEQPEELLLLVESLHAVTEDILVYTGYTMQELIQLLSPAQMDEVKKNIGVLIDGRYVDSQNDNATPLRGSKNQTIIFFNQRLCAPYAAYLDKGRRIQNVYYGNRVLSVGIHNKEMRYE